MRKIVLVFLLLCLTLPVLAQNATMVSVVSQRFEGGEMIYRRDNGDIYVISNVSAQWWRFSSSQYGRLAENTEVAPANRISPINGFGRIWANNAAIRSELAWATNVEIGFEMRFTSADNNMLYLTRLNGIILELSSNNTWRTVSTIPTHGGATINSLTVSPASVPLGGSVTISWEASGADFAQLIFFDTGNTGEADAVVHDLPLSGSYQWTVPESFTGWDVTVVLWLVNSVNSTSPNCCYEWLMSLSRPLDVTSSSISIETYAAYQAYERGFMIWREDSGDVRVFFNTGNWQLFTEASYALNSDNNWPTPENCVPAVNAFGKIWGAYGDLRDAIGCATTGETGYNLQISSSNNEFRYSLPDGSNISITDGTWH